MSRLSKDSEFGPIRSFIWPIYRSEFRMVFTMFLILFLTCINYSVLRNLKDSVVVTASGSGAHVIPFLKTYALLPMAVIVTVIFTKLSNWFSREKVYYITISSFLLFYLLFAFVLYPHADSLHPTASADWLESWLPRGLYGLVSMYRNWTFSLFYVFSELWSTMVMTILFWGFANEVTKISEARRFYAVFGIGSNLAAMIAGLLGPFLVRESTFSLLPWGKNPQEQSLMAIVLVLTVIGCVMMALFRWLNTHLLNDDKYDFLHKPSLPKMKKRASISESFKYLSESKYLIYLAIIVIAYNLTINMVEIVWKDRVKQLYSDSNDYFLYMSAITFWIGLLSTLIAFLMPRILSSLGWLKTALITPITLFVTSLLFFLFIFFGGSLGGLTESWLGMGPLAMVAFLGAAQNCISKAAKYSVFDATKEIAFIPLDHETKLKGKAAIDGVGSRIGKSGGSLLHQGFLVIFSTVSYSTPYVALVILFAGIVWIWATKLLGAQFALLTRGEEEESSSQPEVQLARA